MTTAATAIVGDRVVFDVSDANITDLNYYTIGSTTSDTPLPVFLDGFSASPREDRVVLEWATESEVNNEFFLVERSLDNQVFFEIARVAGQGTTNRRTEYSLSDTQVEPGMRYYYRLADQDFNGNITYHNTIEVVMTAGVDEGNNVGAAFTLSANYPNPFNPSTTIEYRVLEAGNLSLAVYDALGREIDILTTGFHEKGDYRITWNGRDKAGREVPSGIYYYQIRRQAVLETRQMLLLK